MLFLVCFVLFGVFCVLFYHSLHMRWRLVFLPAFSSVAILAQTVGAHQLPAPTIHTDSQRQLSTPTPCAMSSSGTAPPTATGAAVCGKVGCAGISLSYKCLLVSRHERMVSELKAAWDAAAAAESRADAAESRADAAETELQRLMEAIKDRAMRASARAAAVPKTPPSPTPPSLLNLSRDRSRSRTRHEWH